MNELDSWRYNILWKYIYVSRVVGQAVLRAITIPVPYAKLLIDDTAFLRESANST